MIIKGDDMLKKLNQAQKEAVLYTEGPLLVIAGAGSGKTKVLTTKIAYLLQQAKAQPNEILAITFTNKAAKEMQERVQDLVNEKALQMQISTFHAFGVRIFKENYLEMGYGKNFTILDANDSLTLIRKILKELNIDPKMYSPKAIRNAISSCKNNLITAEEYQKFVTNPFEETVQKVYQKYQTKIKTSNSVDFDDLLFEPIKLFQNQPQILKKYQQLFKYILVDEYQDTNEAQYLLIKKLSAYYKNICVVGDESQAIYGFRGANYKNILNFEKDFPNSKVVILEKNYRSTKNILNTANKIIKNNLNRKEKNLWTDNDKGEEVVVNCLPNERYEANYIVDKIEQLQKEAVNLNEIAILYRTNAQSRAIEEAILQKGYPYRIVGSIYFYNRKEIKDLIAYLKLIYNQHDNLALLRVINEPKRGIGQKTIQEIETKAIQKKTSLFYAIDEGKTLVFKNLIIELQKIANDVNLTELIEQILSKTNLRQSLKIENSAMAEIKIENLEEFKTITKEFEEKYGIISLEDFLAEISLVSDVTEYGEETPQITLMTIHAAKGLEFQHVFLVGMEEGLMPHNNSLAEPEELEEERRLCYVAITRAKQQLYILYTQNRTIFGHQKPTIVSRFIDEMALKAKKITTKVKSANNIDHKATYQVGEKVISQKYGPGIIVEISDKVLTIAFKHEIKKFIKGHKSIQKL